MYKKCKMCGKSKERSDFIKTSRGVEHINCKECKRKYERQYRQKNKNKIKKIVKKAKEKREKINLSFIADFLKKHPCIDCGEKDIIVLEFDHKKNKQYAISDLKTNGSLSTLKKEINKCVVRCANCHRRKTALERNYKILKYT